MCEGLPHIPHMTGLLSIQSILLIYHYGNTYLALIDPPVLDIGQWAARVRLMLLSVATARTHYPNLYPIWAY